jgi:4-amino-4-deoxy-L-arabinose transferase-like glycosyltransferase
MDGRCSLLAVSSSSSTRTVSTVERRWRLSLVLPAYNEEAGIRQAVVEACAALEKLTREYEVLVVDDGSSDDTAVLVAELAADHPQVRLLRHERNRGYGAALRTGFVAARFERVAFTDADCQFHLADLGRLMPLSERSPLVVGWRQGRQDPWRRRFLSRGYNLLTSALLGTRVRDCDCALKVFHRDVLPELLPETNTFFVNAEMLTKARQRGMEVAQVGVRHRPRLRGCSKVSVREVPRIAATLIRFWWSHVLFAGDLPASRRASQEGTVSSHCGLALVLLIAALLFFLRLRAPLLEPQEPRYAEIPRQMFEEGRLLVPVLHGEPYLDKPPLLYWLVMGSYAVFGVHDWAARLIPGACGFLTVLLTYLWGRRVVGERVGLCAALVLSLSAEFVYRQRMLNMDSLLCLWVTAALASAHIALTTGPVLRWRWWLLAATLCALGLLSKGPVALVLILMPLFLYAYLDPRCPRIGPRAWAPFVGVAVTLAAPWYIAVLVREPDFAYTFFWRHHVERFVTPFDHEKPAWFYVPGLLAGMLPWSLLLPGFARFLFRRSLRSAQRRPPALGFFLLSCLFCVFFFSASGCKRPAYILPALPPLALALGCYWNVLLPQRRHTMEAGLSLVWRWRSRSAGRAALLVLTLALGIVLLASYKHLLKPGVAFYLAMPAVVGLFLLRKQFISWGCCAAITFAVLVAGVYYLQPAYNRQFALRDQLRRNAALAHLKELRIACYPQRWDSIQFYLPHADVHVYARGQQKQLLADLRTRPQTLLLVKSGKSFEELLCEMPASLEFVPRGRPGFVTAGWVRRRANSAVVFADRMENVESANRLVQGDDLVTHVAGNAIQIAGLQRSLLVADQKDGASLQHHADLLVRMRMLLNDRMRSEIDHR